MRRQVADQARPFFGREAHQAASSKASREAPLIHHRFFAGVGFRAVVGEPIHVKFDIVARSREMHNKMVASRGRSGKVGEVLPSSPSALGDFRLLLLLVFSTSASLEETWIG